MKMTSARFILPNHTVSKLKCDLCHGYLSVPPIYSYKDKYACGRCNPEWERNVIYEQLAQYMVFPCIYCDIGLPWDMMQSHEYKCKENRLFCPPRKQNMFKIISDLNKSKNGESHKDCQTRAIRCPFHMCLTNYKMMDILHHFNKFHKDYIFTNTVEAKKILKEEKVWNFNSDTQVCLMLYNTIPFLLFVHSDYDFNDSTGDILGYNYYFSVFTLCLEQCDIKYSANLQITSGNDIPIVTTLKNQEIKIFNHNIHSVCFLQKDLFKLNSFNFMTTKFTNINRTGKLIVKYSVAIEDNSEQIILEKCNKDSINYNLVSIEKYFECPICKDYMSPPIYNCNTGHTICRHCREKLTLCPYCQAIVGNSRNYILEDILETMYLHCHNEYKGCTFTGKLQEIKLHEVICHFN